MAQSVLIIAESGCGKSTSIESLNPAETFIINVANKPLPFKGWKAKYPAFDPISLKGNCANVSSPKDIEATLKIINGKKEIKNIVIDDSDESTYGINIKKNDILLQSLQKMFSLDEGVYVLMKKRDKNPCEDVFQKAR